MVSTISLERLAAARGVEKGCPWDIPEYRLPSSLQSPMLMWSGDAWDAARAYMDAMAVIEKVVDRLGSESVICSHVGANGTAHSLRECHDMLRGVLPSGE